MTAFSRFRIAKSNLSFYVRKMLETRKMQYGTYGPMLHHTSIMYKMRHAMISIVSADLPEKLLKTVVGHSESIPPTWSKDFIPRCARLHKGRPRFPVTTRYCGPYSCGLWTLPISGRRPCPTGPWCSDSSLRSSRIYCSDGSTMTLFTQFS